MAITVVDPPLGLPSTIQFTNVITQSFTEVEGGRVVDFSGSVVARIEGDTAGVFSVTGLETLALMHGDPDAPPGSREWTTILTVDGAGPISVRAREALGVTVALSVPSDPGSDTFSAAVVVVADGTDSPVLMS